MRVRRWRNLAMSLAYFNVAWNLLLYAANPSRGSLVLAGIWLVASLAWTGCAVIDRRRRQATAQRHEFLMRPQPRLPDPFRRPGQPRSVIILGPGERVLPIPQVGGIRKPQVPTCSHWPRDEVRLADGTTVAYICRRCDHDWADEAYINA